MARYRKSTPHPRRIGTAIACICGAVFVLFCTGVLALHGGTLLQTIRTSLDPEPSAESLLCVQTGAAENRACLAEADLPGLVETERTRHAQARAAELIPFFENRYFLRQLDTDTLLNFCVLYETCRNTEEYCKIPYPMEQKAFLDLIFLLEYECPELLHLVQQDSRITASGTEEDRYAYFTPGYSMTREAYERALAETEAFLEALCAQTAAMSAYEKELFIYDHIIQNNHYEEDAPNAHNAYGTFIENRSRCQGICRAFKWAMDICGVPCICISGIEDGEEVGHAWNVVRIDGVWGDLCATQDDMEHSEQGQFPTAYGLVNVSGDFLRSVYPLFDTYDVYVPPEAASMENSYHGRLGLYASSRAEAVTIFREQLDAAYAAGGGSFSMQFSTADLYEAFLETLYEDLDDWFYDSRAYHYEAAYYPYPAANVFLLEITF